MNERNEFPIQGGSFSRGGRGPGKTNRAVYMKAYEVYAYIYGPQQALIEGGCRGGFGKAELVALLYAASFPREQWRNRVAEASEGTDL